MNHHHRLDFTNRLRALQCGTYPTSSGELVKLSTLPDTHLVNALLKALEDGLPASYTLLLAAEVVSRNLEAYAYRLASERR